MTVEAPGSQGVVGDPRTSDELVGLLAHRPPFRFVDAVEAVTPGERITARYRVTGDEAFLAGHFPGRPTFPGVLLVEALAQAGAIALLADDRFAGSLPLLGGVDRARFRRVAVPRRRAHPRRGGHVALGAGRAGGRARRPSTAVVAPRSDCSSSSRPTDRSSPGDRSGSALP